MHKTYKGPVPLTYVDTGVYEGWSNDYYEVHARVELRWARRLEFIMKHHIVHAPPGASSLRRCPRATRRDRS